MSKELLKIDFNDENNNYIIDTLMAALECLPKLGPLQGFQFNVYLDPLGDLKASLTMDAANRYTNDLGISEEEEE